MTLSIVLSILCCALGVVFLYFGSLNYYRRPEYTGINVLPLLPPGVRYFRGRGTFLGLIGSFFVIVSLFPISSLSWLGLLIVILPTCAWLLGRKRASSL